MQKISPPVQNLSWHKAIIKLLVTGCFTEAILLKENFIL